VKQAPPPEVEVASKAVPETGRRDAVERERTVQQQDAPATIGDAENRAGAPAANSGPGSSGTQPSKQVKPPAPVVSPKAEEAEAKIKETAPTIKPKPPLPKDNIASETASGTTRTEVARGETAQTQTGGDSASTVPPVSSENSGPAVKCGNETGAGKAVGEHKTVALNEQTTGWAGEKAAGKPVGAAPVAPPIPGKRPERVTDNGSETTADRAAAQEQTVALNTETTDAPDTGREAAPTPNPEDCFFAAIANQSDEAMTIKGIGLSMAPFERIKSALASSDSGDARIDGHIITASQCPAAAFIKEIYGTTTDNPKLNFTSAGMVSGDAVAGSVNNVHSRRVHLFMVDGKGVVYDLQDNLAIANNPPLFRLTFGRARANFAPPGVIIALTSDQPIDLGPPFGASSSLPALARRLADRGDVSGIDFAFFPYRSLGSASSP
jgi:serine/threonine-protein kinase